MKTIFGTLQTLEQMQKQARTQGAKDHLQLRIDRIKQAIIQESEDNLFFI